MECEVADPATILAEYAKQGPRYTSYPPATEFAPIHPDRIKRELASIGQSSAPVSLYVHIPFCKSLCAYCGCNVIPTRDETRGDRYVDQLATEMTLLVGSLFTAPISEIALGGGSPNFLNPRSLRTLVSSIERYFAVSPHARRSIELDPRTTSSTQIDTLADLKFRSVSLGVQDFAEPVQDAIRRHQSVVQTKWLVDRSRDAGFDDVNIDIVYGLPRQTEQSFAQTIDTVIEMTPDRVAMFGYAHLPAKLPHQKIVEKAGRILDGYERATLLLMAIEKFKKAGYLHLGLDHFASPNSRLAKAAAAGNMTRTFQGYVERQADTIIGLGLSAISSTRRMHWQNQAVMALWERDIAECRLPIRRGIVLDRDDRARRALIGHLMCEGEVDLAKLGEEHTIDCDSYFAAELRSLAQLPDLAGYDPATHVLSTTPLGKLLVRNVCMVFDRYLQNTDQPRFSSTI